MVTFLEILAGPHEGSRYRLDAGIQVGRTKGHIQINDPKVSALHAQIELDGKGQFVLVDLESSNGLIINGRRVKRVALLPGVSFEIGRTPCRVVTVNDVEAEDYGRVVTWRTALQDALTDHKGRNETLALSGKIFAPLLKLRFIQGVQSDQIITLGYGPRVFGANTLDIELLDPGAPSLAFEISPVPGGAQIKNLSDRSVLLNNHMLKTETLTDGDVISVGSTLIKVSYA
jgi:pSer/pThr/pTyr-binding forkhead associated (FHA) protein